MLTCRSLRAAVILSAALLFSGVLLGLIVLAQLLPAPVAQLSLLLVLGGAAVLGVTFLVSLIPGVAHRLEGCQH